MKIIDAKLKLMVIYFIDNIDHHWAGKEIYRKHENYFRKFYLSEDAHREEWRANRRWFHFRDFVFVRAYFFLAFWTPTIDNNNNGNRNDWKTHLRCKAIKCYFGFEFGWIFLILHHEFSRSNDVPIHVRKSESVLTECAHVAFHFLRKFRWIFYFGAWCARCSRKVLDSMRLRVNITASLSSFALVTATLLLLFLSLLRHFTNAKASAPTTIQLVFSFLFLLPVHRGSMVLF